MTLKRFALVLVLVTVGCAQPPPNLTPQASVAFTGTQVVKALDLLRDMAIDAHAQVPPLLSEATTRQVVLYHQSTVKIIQGTPAGWASATRIGLDELAGNLPPPDRALLAPYIALAKAILEEVTR